MLIDTVGQKFPLTCGDDGVWAGVTEPVLPGFHYYAIVDGLRVTDPGTRTFFGVSQWMSGVDVPDPADAFYQARDTSRRQTAHEWQTWRRSFFGFVPLLF